MKHCIGGKLAGVLVGARLMPNPPADTAGCLYGGIGIINKCDGPIQPDGTWQRCVAFATWVPSGASSFPVPDKRCDVIGPDQHPQDPAFNDPPARIGD